MIRTLFALALVLALSPVASAKKSGAQADKMTSCNAAASAQDLKGDARKTFMSECLKGPAGEKKLTAQQQKMKDCNATAKEKALKGAERKAFMSTCLKK